MDVQQAYREAVARVQARRLSQEPMQPGESLVPRRDFEAAGNASEWADDRIARTPPVLGDWVAVAYEIALASGDSAAAAVKAVSSARTLSNAWDRYHLYEALEEWRRDMHPDVSKAMTEVKYEWEDLGLPMTAPVDEPLPQGARWAKAKKKQEERPKVKYRSRWGHPAGMAY